MSESPIEGNNIGPSLDVIFDSYEDPDRKYIQNVLTTLNEDVETISSDSDNSEIVAETINGRLVDYNNIERKPFCKTYEDPPNGANQQSPKSERSFKEEWDSETERNNAAESPRPTHERIFPESPEPDIKRSQAAESPKSSSSESSKNRDSKDSSSDSFDFPSTSENSSDDELDNAEQHESYNFYHPMPISVGPLPSMPLYDMDFNLVEDVPEVVPIKIKEEVLSEGECESKPLEDKAQLSESESESIDSLAEFMPNSEANSVYPEVFYPSEGKKKFKYWEDTAKRPIDKGEIPEEELQAILKEEEKLRKNEKSSYDSRSEDSDEGEDSGREDAKRNGLDFYEDIVQFQIGSTTSSRLLVVKDESVFLEYEECIKQLQQLIQLAPSIHKYEIYLLLYPLIALTYLQMMASDNFPRARVFLNRFTSQLDDSFTPRFTKLLSICRPAEVPHRARKLLAGFEKLEMHMSAGAYTQFVEHMEGWTKAQQDKVLTHFLVRRYSEMDEPKQRFAPGQPLLEVIFWAAPEPLHKTDYTSRPLLRARRRKKGSLPDRNIHLPPTGKIYTPTPKRMDLLRRKTDEQYRKKLDRNNLPSAYVYTAPNCDEVVTCATFSEGVGMLAVGTVSSSIHIFSLKSSKLVQLKPAHWLKALDTGMAGIDKGMLDPTKKYSRRTLRGHQGAVYRLSFNPEDRYLLSCSEDCSMRLWCLMSWNCVVIYPGHLSPVCCVIYAPLGYYFATASDDCTARVWVQDNKRAVRILKGHLAELEVCLFHPNRHYLATGSADATVRLWDIPKGAQVRLFAGHRGRVTALAFSACGRHLVSGGDDSLIMIWDITNEKLVHFLSHHKSAINTIQFCLDSNLLLAGGQDCQLTIWDFKKILHHTKSTRSRKHAEIPQAKDFLIKSFYTRNAAFYTIRFTRRNLLLAFCVAAREPERHLQMARERQENEERRREDLGEWMEFLDLIKMKAVMSG
nr:transcription initiation factor TFIID subunit 5 [Drosophila kikkawai]